MNFLQSVTVSCPYCGESIDTQVDLSAGSQRYIEDCPVCCQPMEMDCRVDADGTLQALQARRQQD